LPDPCQQLREIPDPQLIHLVRGHAAKMRQREQIPVTRDSDGLAEKCR
jgi:hypothetical protein